MVTRCRWFNIGLPCSYEHLNARLRLQTFSDEAASGFAIDRSESNRISGNFISRTSLKILRVQPDGSTGLEDVGAISLLPFEIFTRGKSDWLKIFDPPRSTRDLTNALERVIGMGFFVEPVIFSYETFKSMLQKVDECRLVSTKGIAALHESGALARIELASKDGIALDKIPLLKGLEYIVDTAVYEVNLRRERGQVSFSRSGMVRINGRLSPRIMELIEETFD